MDGAWTANLTEGAAVLLCGLSLTLAVVGFLSFGRLRAGRLLWVGLAFLGFAVEGASLAWWAFTHRADVAAGSLVELPAVTGLNLAIVLCLYFAVLKR